MLVVRCELRSVGGVCVTIGIGVLKREGSLFRTCCVGVGVVGVVGAGSFFDVRIGDIFVVIGDVILKRCSMLVRSVGGVCVTDDIGVLKRKGSLFRTCCLGVAVAVAVAGIVYGAGSFFGVVDAVVVGVAGKKCK
tara:strand:- start:127 stop:531 length:405 start_codon:yes stop_codon:yes gene_type:complete